MNLPIREQLRSARHYQITKKSYPERTFFTPSEVKRISLLDKMTQVPYFDIKGGTQIDQAFRSLNTPLSDGNSILQLTKAFLFEGSPAEVLKSDRLQQEERLHKSNLIRWLVIEALQQRPQLFGEYASDLIDFFELLRLEEIGQKVHQAKESDRKLSHIRHGECFANLTEFQMESLTRLSEGKPLVIAMPNAFYGDTFLVAQAVADIADTLDKVGSNSKIRFVVHKNIAESISVMLSSWGRIEIISAEKEVSPLLLARLSVDTREPETFDLTLDTYAAQTGIILGWEVNDISYYNDSPNTLYSDFRPGFGVPDDEGNIHAAHNYRRIMQREFSHILGLKIFNAYKRDSMVKFRRNMHNLLAERKDSSQVEEVNKGVGSDSRFANGYIAVFTAGSMDAKHLTEEIAHAISAKFRQPLSEKKVGILVINTLHKNPLDGESQFTAKLREEGIPVIEFSKTQDLLDTMKLLKYAKGVIGPDSLLIHMAMLLHHKIPILSFYPNANKTRFSIHKRLHAIQHPLASHAEANMYPTVYDPVDLYKDNLIHPFTLVNHADSNMHPLVYLAQQTMTQRVKEGLDMFISEMDRPRYDFPMHSLRHYDGYQDFVEEHLDEPLCKAPARMEKGVINHTFKVRSKNRTAYLKVHGYAKASFPDSPKNPDDSLIEYRAIELYSAVEPSLFPHVLGYDEMRSALLLTPVSSTDLSLLDILLGSESNLDIFLNVGKALGKAHLSLSQLSSIIKTIRSKEREEIFFADLQNSRLGFSGNTTLKAAIHDLKETYQRQFVIGDLVAKNVMFEGLEAKFIDLERAHSGLPILDVASLLAEVFLYTQRNKLQMENSLYAFKDGYNLSNGNLDFDDRRLKICILGYMLFYIDKTDLSIPNNILSILRKKIILMLDTRFINNENISWEDLFSCLT